MTAWRRCLLEMDELLINLLLFTIVLKEPVSLHVLKWISGFPYHA